MSHNLMQDRAFAEVQGNKRFRAWHFLGETVDVNERPTCIDLGEKAGVFYKIGKFPLVANLGKDKEGNIRTFEMEDQFAILREPMSKNSDPIFFGTCSKSYTIVQNREICEWLDKMNGWTPETIGALGNGEKFFVSLALGSFEVAGDQIDEYFVMFDTKDTTGGLQFFYTPVRVVCQNTLSYGLERANNRVSLNHTSLVKQEAKELLSIYEHLKKIQKEGQNSLQSLLEVKLNNETAKSMIEQVYPIPAMPKKLQLAKQVDGAIDTPLFNKDQEKYQKEVNLTKLYRHNTFDLYENFNDTHPIGAGTGYALYNAITEYEDHIKESRNAQIRAESAAFGERANIKSNAFRLIKQGV